MTYDLNQGFRQWDTNKRTNDYPSLTNAYDAWKVAQMGLPASEASAVPTIAQVAGADSPLLAAEAPGSVGLGPLAAVAGATYLGGKAGYDMLKGKTPGTPGRVVLGMATGGLSELANSLNHKSATRVEEHLRDKLAGEGITVPTNPDAPHGKAWELNPEFASTRDESKLKSGDVKDAAWLYANVPDYAKYSDDQKNKIASEWLKGGVREHHGTIEGSVTPGLTSLLDSYKNPAPTANAGESRRDRTRSKAQSLLSLLPMAPTTYAPDYSSKIKNPYL